MPKIDDYIVRRVIESANIVDVVGDFLKLRKTGTRYTAICPFHDDRHDGNFIVYPKGNCFRCFTCDAKGGTVDFLMRHCGMTFPDAIRWLGKKYSIETDMTDFNYTPPPPRPAPAPLPMLVLPMDMVRGREDTRNDVLCNWLRSLPWDGTQAARVPRVLAEYHVGHARQGHTIFWQIDEQDRVRTGKMMLYGADGHRDKTTRYNFDWIHSALFRDARHPEYDGAKQEMRQTLFGMHLLNLYPKAAVHIVESEKTAVIMAIAYGNNIRQVWMACGGAENLSHERLEPVIAQGRRIILYPDRDAIDKWREKTARLRYDRLTVNVQAVKDWWMPEDGEKADIADVVIRSINDSKPLTVIDDVKANMPQASGLIDKLNLEIDKEETE